MSRAWASNWLKGPHCSSHRIDTSYWSAWSGWRTTTARASCQTSYYPDSLGSAVPLGIGSTSNFGCLGGLARAVVACAAGMAASTYSLASLPRKVAAMADGKTSSDWGWRGAGSVSTSFDWLADSFRLLGRWISMVLGYCLSVVSATGTADFDFIIIKKPAGLG